MIAIDASTPALSAASNDPWTSASFTPPADSLIVAVVMGDWFGGTPTIGITDSLGQLSFQSRKKQGALSNGVVEIFTCDVGSFGGAARTLSATTTLASDVGGVKPYVLTGADNASPVDTTNGANANTTNNLTVSALTTGQDGCWVLGGGVEWNSLGVPTSNDVGEGFDDVDLSLLCVRKSSAFITGSVTLNLDAFGTGVGDALWTWAAISIKPAPVAAAQLRVGVSRSGLISV